MKKLFLRDGQEITIRKAIRSDAPKIIQYLSVIGGESDNLTFGLNELEITIDKEELIIESLNSRDNSIMIIAETSGKIISMLSLGCGTRPRTMHVGEFGVTVRKQYWNLGIGSAMIEYMIEWARTYHIIRKINLRVRADNVNAIALYKKHGFKEEGIATRDLCIKGRFYDSILMGLEID